jgi:type IV pilus assembly protein PilO
MANLAETRRNLTVVTAILGLISLFALLYLLAPLTSAPGERYKELDQTRAELKNTERQVLPLRGLPTKLEKSQHDIRMFYRERLPSRYSLISEELGKVAARNGVSLSGVQYDTLETDLPELELVTMNVAVTGDYGKVMRFINGVERNKIFFLIDGLTLADQKAGVVRLDLRLEAYLRLAPEPNLGPPAQKANKQSRTGD